MNKNNNTAEDIIRNVEDEASDVIDQIEKDISEEVADPIKDHTEDYVENQIEDHTQEQIAEQTANEYFEARAEEEEEARKSEGKQQKAIRLVEQARAIVKEADDVSEECTLLLRDDLAEYEDAKINLKERGFDTCNALLKGMGYRSTEEELEEEAVVLEPKAIVKPVVIKEVSSGKFTGVLAALRVDSAGRQSHAGRGRRRPRPSRHKQFNDRSRSAG